MRFFFLLFIIASLLVSGCGAGERDDAAALSAKDSYAGEVAAKTRTVSDGLAVANGAPPSEENGMTATLASQRSVIQNRMVIRTAEVTLRVDSVEKAEHSVQKIMEGFGGYVDNASSSDLDSDHPTLTLSMRVPAQSFDTAIGKLEGLGVRTSKSITSQDVTEKVVDMDARLKSMLAQEETYRGLLKAARKLDDVISLQQQLTDVRGNIESLAGQRKSMASQAALSTISLTLTQSAVVSQPPKDPNWMAQSWAEATTSVGGVFRNLAVVGIWMVLFSWVWVPLLWLAWRAAKSAAPKKRPVAVPSDF